MQFIKKETTSFTGTIAVILILTLSIINLLSQTYIYLVIHKFRRNIYLFKFL